MKRKIRRTNKMEGFDYMKVFDDTFGDLMEMSEKALQKNWDEFDAQQDKEQKNIMDETCAELEKLGIDPSFLK
jgi:hypothetical protein